MKWDGRNFSANWKDKLIKLVIPMEMSPIEQTEIKLF